MPVDFLTAEQKANYGKFSGVPNNVQLARYFHLDEADRAFINRRRGEQNRLGVALQLSCIRFLGTSLTDLTLVPVSVQRFVASQIDVTDLSILTTYAQRETTRQEHNLSIRRHYQYREFSRPWSFRLTRLLFTRCWINNERPSLLFDLATGWLIQHKVLLPGSTTLIHLISEVRKRATNRLWRQLSSLPSPAQITELETLLKIPTGARVSRFDHLRKGPVTISGPAFNEAVDRYQELKYFDIQALNFTGIPPVRFKSLARHAGIISMHKVARMPERKRTAILVSFVKAYETIALDEALDVLDMLITSIAGEAKKRGQKARLRTLKDLDKSALKLAEVCALILSESTHDNELRSSIFEHITREILTQSIATVHELARPSDENFQHEMVEQYGRVRRFLPKLLRHIEFKSTPAGISTLTALQYLSGCLESRKERLDEAPLEIVSNPWKRLILDAEGHVTKRGYTLCFLDKLQDSLRRRDVYVQDSDRWGDPRAKLLQGQEWQTNRVQVYRSLGHSLNPKEAIDGLLRQLDAAYLQVAANFDDNKSVKLDHSGKRPTLTITHFEKLDDSPSFNRLSQQVAALIPSVDLTELLLEVHAHTGFAEEFTHVSESNARADELTTSVCAVLLSEACNIGIDPLVKAYIPALTGHRLNWVKQNYLRAETLAKANAKLVDHQTKLSLAGKWGGGEVASADGMRFTTPVRTINAGANRKYFGSSRGITWYNFLSNQYSGFHGIVVPETLRDSIFVLEGLLEQQTGLNPMEIMTDTAGASDMVFGLFWLLGYQFSPRLADAGASVFWRSSKETDYGVLDDLARSCVSPQKIEQHWDDMMRMAGSLRLGVVHASELTRSLLKSDRPSSLAQAIIEAGRINKTIYLLNYIDDEDYRRQLNRGESRHAVARAIATVDEERSASAIERDKKTNSVPWGW